MRVEEDTSIAEPPAFDRLPYNDGRRDINAGTPFLAEHVLPAPFTDASPWLPPGIHLHWSLPAFLTAGRHDPDGIPSPSMARVNGLDFPVLPNRWLVRTPAQEWWMVESDYVHPELEHLSRPAVSYLLTPDEQRRLGTTAPFRFVGRQMRLRDWAAAERGNPLGAITAAGWGDPIFHTFYPYCWSILGFHDADPDPTATGGTYDVYGYYADQTTDPVAEFVAANASLDIDDLRTAVNDRFGVESHNLEEWPWVPPSRLLVVGSAAVPDAFDPPNGLDSITVGASGSEAMAAHLAHAWSARGPGGSLAEIDEDSLEEAIEALVLAPRLDMGRPDSWAKLREARHENGFVGVDGGSRWRVRTKGPGFTADAAHAPAAVHGSAPDEVAGPLIDLNRIQGERDRLARQQNRLSEQLYADWCTYLLCKYPPRGGVDDYPDPDEIRRHIELDRLARLDVIVTEYRRLLAATTDLATEAITLLAEADLDRLRVTGADVTDWAALASALSWLGVGRSVLGGVDQTDEAAWQGALLEVANAAVVDDPIPVPTVPTRPGVTIDDTIAEWLLTPPPSLDEVVTESAPVRHQIFGRDDEPTDLQRDRWIEHLTELVGRWHRAARARMVLELAAAGGVKTATKDRHHLEVTPGSRFWSPRDPVLVLQGPAAARSLRRPPGVPDASVLPVGDAPASWLPRAVTPIGPTATDLAAEIRRLILHLPGGNLSAGAGGSRFWHPVTIDWKVSIDAEGGPFPFAGRANLSGHLTAELADAIDRLAPADRARGTIGGLVDWIGGYLAQHESTLQSISLTGFNTAHLMHQSILPLPVADPHGFAESQEFARRVAGAIGRHTTMAPIPLGVFRPVRSGAVSVDRLRAVDSFGRAVDLHTGSGPPPLAIHGSEALRRDELSPVDGPGVEGSAVVSEESPAAAAASVVAAVAEAVGQRATSRPAAAAPRLPMRVIPPVRLQLRWLAARPPEAPPVGGVDAPAVEAADHPSVGPVCGWLAPNLLEGRLMVHEASGAPIGSIDQTGQWRPAPGQDRYVPPQDIAEPGLRNVVVQLLHESATQQGATLDRIRESLETIQPDSHAQHRALGLLVGRPMAVVRASVRLELLGLAPLDQSWDAYQSRTRGETDPSGLLARRFPIRFGEPGQLDDGVVGFWIESDGEAQGNATPFHGPLYTPQLAASGHAVDRSAQPGVLEASGGHLTLTLDGPSVALTLLMDPRGTLHATTGIVPTKVIDIPAEQFAPALDRIGVTFLTAPLLCDPGTIQVTLPAEPGFAWSWLQRSVDGWSEVGADQIGTPSTTARLTGQQRIVEGWLKLSPAPAEPAGAASNGAGS